MSKRAYALLTNVNVPVNETRVVVLEGDINKQYLELCQICARSHLKIAAVFTGGVFAPTKEIHGSDAERFLINSATVDSFKFCYKIGYGNKQEPVLEGINPESLFCCGDPEDCDIEGCQLKSNAKPEETDDPADPDKDELDLEDGDEDTDPVVEHDNATDDSEAEDEEENPEDDTDPLTA